MTKNEANRITKEAALRNIRNLINQKANEGVFSVNITLPDKESIGYFQSLGYKCTVLNQDTLEIDWS